MKPYAGELAGRQAGPETSVHIINESIICHTCARPAGAEGGGGGVEGGGIGRGFGASPSATCQSPCFSHT